MIYAITLILLAFGPGPKWPADLACDPALTILFTPPRPRLGQYEACTTQARLEEAAVDGFEYGRPEQLEALDLFGTTGTYDRAKLSRLYGGRRARVLRGWRRDADQFESVTLISPYPDVGFERLNSGTMIIRWMLSAKGAKDVKGSPL